MARILREPTAFHRLFPASTEVSRTHDGPMIPEELPLSTRGRRGPGTSVPPMLLFSAAFAAGVWWNGLQPWLIMTTGDPTLSVLVGSTLVAAGLMLFAAGLHTFWRARTGIMLQHAATRVVSHGPYSWSRNPMYASFVAIYVGACLLANTPWPLVLLPLVIFVMNRVVIAREERYMRETFPVPYGAYTRRVPRWI